MLLTSDEEDKQVQQQEDKPDFMIFAEMDGSALEEVNEFEDFDIN